MLLSDFSFDLPASYIATEPKTPRDQAKLLYIHSVFEDHIFKDLPSLLRPGDLLVCNNSAVIPAQLTGKKGEAIITMTLLKKLDSGCHHCLAKPGKKLKIGDRVVFGEKFSADILEKSETGIITVQFNDPENFEENLAQYGRPPLPPYILKKRAVKEEDKIWYQTIYASPKGSMACPTAGLHFTEEVQASLKKNNIDSVYVTLHVGAGTFSPVRTENVSNHIMHGERGIISKDVAKRINETKKAGGRIIAVGTTSLRLLEAATDDQGIVHPYDDETHIFILPGYRFKAVDMLLTNFHLPKTTLFMLVCAFAGKEKMLHAYHYAMEHHYRFYSYGDSSLICLQQQHYHSKEK